MLTSSEEVATANQVVNGVDSPNLYSVDSTSPVETVVEKVDENGKVVVGNVEGGKEVEPDAEEEESEVEAEESSEIQKVEEKSEAQSSEEDEDKSYSAKVQKRIGNLTKKMRSAERNYEEEKSKRKELEKKLAQLTEEKVTSNKPKKEDFENDDEYIEALVDWKTELRLAKENSAKQEEVEESVVEKTSENEDELENEEVEFEGLNNVVKAGTAKHADFEEKVFNEKLKLSKEVVQLALDAENPDDILYHLATNPEESARISSLSEINAAKEIGKIEFKLLSEGKRKPQKQSHAPTPITPVKAGSVLEKDPEHMSPKEYKAWRAKNN